MDAYHTPRAAPLVPGNVMSETPAVILQHPRQHQSVALESWNQDFEYITPEIAGGVGRSRNPPQNEIPSFVLPPTYAAPSPQGPSVIHPPRASVMNVVNPDNDHSQALAMPRYESSSVAESPRKPFTFSQETEHAIKSQLPSKCRRAENGKVKDETQTVLSLVMQDIDRYAESCKKVVRDDMKRDLEMMQTNMSPKDKSLHRSRREARVSRVKSEHQASAMKEVIYYLLQEVSELKQQTASCKCSKLPKRLTPG